jgi:hypothetical protein
MRRFLQSILVKKFNRSVDGYSGDKRPGGIGNRFGDCFFEFSVMTISGAADAVFLFYGQ